MNFIEQSDRINVEVYHALVHLVYCILLAGVIFGFLSWRAARHLYYMHALYIIHILYVYVQLFTYFAGRPQCQKPARQQLRYTADMAQTLLSIMLEQQLSGVALVSMTDANDPAPIITGEEPRLICITRSSKQHLSALMTPVYSSTGEVLVKFWAVRKLRGFLSINKSVRTLGYCLDTLSCIVRTNRLFLARSCA